MSAPDFHATNLELGGSGKSTLCGSADTIFRGDDELTCAACLRIQRDRSRVEADKGWAAAHQHERAAAEAGRERDEARAEAASFLRDFLCERKSSLAKTLLDEARVSRAQKEMAESASFLRDFLCDPDHHEQTRSRAKRLLVALEGK